MRPCMCFAYIPAIPAGLDTRTHITHAHRDSRTHNTQALSLSHTMCHTHTYSHIHTYTHGTEGGREGGRERESTHARAREKPHL